LSGFAIPSTYSMTLERRDVGRRAALAVAGEVDLASSPDLRSEVAAALDAGAHELWVDLSATTFMDSSGLHVLLDAHRSAEELRRRLTIICPPGNVRRVFDLTELTKTLRVYDDRAAAQRDT
jgi:anti-sigma B factor antagonist